jgi:hypothetical protein
MDDETTPSCQLCYSCTQVKDIEIGSSGTDWHSGLFPLFSGAKKK